jgi:hypothetical protein
MTLYAVLISYVDTNLITNEHLKHRRLNYMLFCISEWAQPQIIIYGATSVGNRNVSYDAYLQYIAK